MSLEGRVAVVTGAGRGIGRAIAVELAKAGCSLVICDVNKDGIDTLSLEISKLGRKVLSLRTDVSKSSEVQKMFDDANAAFGRVDILVNNAGVLRTTPVMGISEDEWDWILDVNLKGTFLCTKAALKGMIERRYGKIVSLSSIDYLRGASPNHLHYGSSKAAITGFTKTLAREVGQYGINVNAVAPGVIETEMTKELLNKLRNQYLEDISLGRIGKPEDVAKAVVFLASDDSAYISGQTINVNGGMLGGMA